MNEQQKTTNTRLPENEKPKKKGKVWSIIGWVITGLIIALFLVVALFQIDGAIHQDENYGQRLGFGVGNFIIETDSMEPEYPVGTAIVTKKTDPDEIAEDFLTQQEEGKTADEIHIDLTFYYGDPVYTSSGVDGKTDEVSSLSAYPITHRLINVKENTTDVENNGNYIFILAGINTEAAESLSAADQYQAIYGKYILGKVIINSPGLGGFLSFVMSPWGLILLILLPALYVLISYGVSVYKRLKEQEKEEKAITAGGAPTDTKPDASASSGEQKASSDDPLAGLSEEDKERLKQEMLEEMLNESEKGNGKK